MLAEDYQSVNESPNNYVQNLDAFCLCFILVKKHADSQEFFYQGFYHFNKIVLGGSVKFQIGIIICHFRLHVDFHRSGCRQNVTNKIHRERFQGNVKKAGTDVYSMESLSKFQICFCLCCNKMILYIFGALACRPETCRHIGAADINPPIFPRTYWHRAQIFLGSLHS